MINTVKHRALISTPDDYMGYVVNGNMYIPIDDNNVDYQEVQVWIDNGNTPEPAFTEEELADYSKINKIKMKNREIEDTMGGMTIPEAMYLMLQYGMLKMNGITPAINLTPSGESLEVWGDKVAADLEIKIKELRDLD